jgi:hypothetical protein
MENCALQVCKAKTLRVGRCGRGRSAVSVSAVTEAAIAVLAVVIVASAVKQKLQWCHISQYM